MNKTDIEKICADSSSSATFNLTVRLENGRVTERQRAMVAAIIQRVCTGLTQQLDYAVPDRFDITLKRVSSAHGEVDLDVGAPE